MRISDWSSDVCSSDLFLIERVGYKRAIIIGLLIMAAGALGMVPAARLPSYEITLLALFVIACGIALLQVAANPYVAVKIGRASCRERVVPYGSIQMVAVYLTTKTQQIQETIQQ